MTTIAVKNKYIDLINQTFYFPRHGFEVKNNNLFFHDVDLMELINEFGTPLKFTYLPKIGAQIEKARLLFSQAMEQYEYKGKYNYLYCTKSSHFSFILDEVLKNGCDIETSSSFDLELLRNLFKQGKIRKDQFIVCNGFKNERYVKNMVTMVEEGFENLICVLDNPEEFEMLDKFAKKPMKLGFRVATEEEPGSLVYTSRMGMSYKRVVDFYNSKIKNNSKYSL
ncbi:MAG: arginine decarboxylase, partial [Bacteroidia bacterium]